MQIKSDLADAVGNTPLIKLRAASEATGCTILGKAEFLNPGQSVKDRAALFMIRDAIARGDLKPGGTIVEGTAGNTGIGLALVGASMGFKTVIVIPETQSQEKKDMLTLAGAELVQVPAVPYANTNNYVKYSQRLAAKLAETEPNGAIWANQFDNVAKGVKVALTDPDGSGLYKLFTDETPPAGDSISEGIGQGRITANLEGFKPDFAYKVPDAEALPIVFDLLADEGLCMGGSTGINIAGAIRMAKDLGPGSTIVTVLCDYGTRYQSKLYNPDFLSEKGLPVPSWLEGSGRSSRNPSDIANLAGGGRCR